jgi:carbamate kinase
MRIVIALDGELLVPTQSGSGIHGQRNEIISLVQALHNLTNADHEIVITHGNATQVGFVLMRSEAASHFVHRIPLDVCGADTQGATGYMLQQALLNDLHQNHIQKDVFTVITQVLVNASQPDAKHPRRGVGPYYDREKANAYSSLHGWEFTQVPGFGYRRTVPSLTPLKIIEQEAIRKQICKDRIVICAGGGGVPVAYDGRGDLVGVEAVIDKALTTSLLASEIQADCILFVTVQIRIEEYLHHRLQPAPVRLPFDPEMHAPTAETASEDIQQKLIAGQRFLKEGGTWMVITAPAFIGAHPTQCGGILLEKEIVSNQASPSH